MSQMCGYRALQIEVGRNTFVTALWWYLLVRMSVLVLALSPSPSPRCSHQALQIEMGIKSKEYIALTLACDLALASPNL